MSNVELDGIAEIRSLELSSYILREDGVQYDFKVFLKALT